MDLSTTSGIIITARQLLHLVSSTPFCQNVWQEVKNTFWQICFCLPHMCEYRRMNKFGALKIWKSMQPTSLLNSLICLQTVLGYISWKWFSMHSLCWSYLLILFIWFTFLFSLSFFNAGDYIMLLLMCSTSLFLMCIC